MLETLPAATGAENKPAAKRPKRFVGIGSNLGYYRPAFYPTKDGFNYEASPLLKPLNDLRSDFTVFSGFDHRAGNGHKNWDNFLCGKQIGSFTLDQMIAESVGQKTRYPSIQLCAGEIPKQKMSFSKRGTPLPMLNRPSAVYRKIFTTKDDREHTEYLLKSGRSAIDSVRNEAKSLRNKVSASDRAKLDEYFSSLREVERGIGRQLEHLATDAAEVEYQLPPYDPIAPTLMLECERIMLDLIALALQTDATRVATLFIAGLGQVFTLDGRTMQAGYHALSHHGNDPDLIRDLIRVETEHVKCFNRFLTKLKTTFDQEGKPLLDETIVLIGTGMGDASRHSNRDLPTIVAGGDFKHGQHVANDLENPDSLLLGDVFLSILHKFQIEREGFSGASRGIGSWA